MTNLDSILKSRDTTLPTKVFLVKAMVFPVVMHGCESWTIKKPEHRRIDAVELWCWRRLLRVPWTARRSNQSILKIGLGYSLEGLMLKLKLQYFDHLMRRTDSLEKTLERPWCWKRLKAWGEGDDRGWDGWMASPTWMNMSLSKLRELVMYRKAWCAAVYGATKNQTQRSSWTELNSGNLIEPNGRFVESATVSFEPPGGAISHRIWALPEHAVCIPLVTRSLYVTLLHAMVKVAKRK